MTCIHKFPDICDMLPQKYDLHGNRRPLDTQMVKFLFIPNIELDAVHSMNFDRAHRWVDGHSAVFTDEVRVTAQIFVMLDVKKRPCFPCCGRYGRCNFS